MTPIAHLQGSSWRRNAGHKIAITSHAHDARVSGTITLIAHTSDSIGATAVSFQIGGYTVAATEGTAEVWSASWNTTVKLSDGVTASPNDAAFFVRATADTPTGKISTPFIMLVTANSPQSVIAGGWRSALAWSAVYNSTKTAWQNSYDAMVGEAYANLVDDPILGASRKVVHIPLPDSAKNDAEQPTSNPRFQAQSAPAIIEGDEFYMGFAFLIDDTFPTMYAANDPADPDYPDANGNGYIALFQFYGPPYTQGSPLVLHARRDAFDDPVDVFHITGNELNPGDPSSFLQIPYTPGVWCDVVLGIHASRSIEDGWMEAHVNWGNGVGVKQIPGWAGVSRVPRVLLRSDSDPFRVDMQIYRRASEFDTVTVWHTGHKIGQTVESVDPHSHG